MTVTFWYICAHRQKIDTWLNHHTFCRNNRYSPNHEMWTVCQVNVFFFRPAIQKSRWWVVKNRSRHVSRGGKWRSGKVGRRFKKAAFSLNFRSHKYRSPSSVIKFRALNWVELVFWIFCCDFILPTSQDESEFLHKLLITDLQIGEKIWIELNKLFKCYVRIFSVNYPNRDR